MQYKSFRNEYCTIYCVVNFINLMTPSLKKLYIGADHRGVNMKCHLIRFFHERGYDITDVGTNSSKMVDYPDIAKKVAGPVSNGNGKGILICGTGIGMDIAANKFVRVRAATVWNQKVATSSRREDDTNILCLPNDFLTKNEAVKITQRWLTTSFSSAKRYHRRKRKLTKLGR
ncbi:RpiB/LacA/LacB family sugar-phosphate isomerase [Patescibacteria group bacterium]